MIGRLLASMLALVVNGCGGDDGSEPDGSASTNQIERLSTPATEEGDPSVTVRLQPLTMSDLEREGLLGAGCLFSTGDRVLLAAVGSNAIVRIHGEVRHLLPSAPVGPTGGFFEDRHLSVSVGRTEEAGVAVAEGMRWAGRITVTNRRAEIEAVQAGAWTCGS
jgi:hypothetical protein